MNSNSGRKRRVVWEGGACGSPWTQTSFAPLCSTLQLPVCLCWGQGVDFSRPLGPAQRHAHQTATLTWVRLSVLSSAGTSCARRAWCRGLEDTGRVFPMGQKETTRQNQAWRKGEPCYQLGPPNSRAPGGSAVHYWESRPVCVGGRPSYFIILVPSS